MTPTELRELDAEVAEKVMGLDVITQPGGKWQDFHYTNPGRIAVKNYSTSISAAWEVVAYLMKALRPRAMQLVPEVRIQSNAKGWTVNINGSGVKGVETAPLAICKAALKAMEGK